MSSATEKEGDMKLEVLEAADATKATTDRAVKEPVRMWTVVYSVLTTCLLSLLVGASIAFSSPVLVELTQLQDPDFRFNTQLSDIFGVRE